MTIGKTELEQIGTYVRTQLSGWLDELRPRREAEIPVQLLERMVRVEEELKSQREVMTARFDAMDQRFEDVLDRMDTRFEAVDRRFEDAREQINARFAAIDKRFESSDRRFEDLIGYMNKRFGLVQWVMGIGFIMIGTLVTVFGVIA